MQSVRMLPVSIAIIAIFCASSFAENTKSKEPKVPSGEATFKQYCSKCHVEGANILKPHHPIAGSDKLANIGVFKQYLQKPPGHMPYYEAVVKDQKVLQSLYDYCKKLKPHPVKEASADDLSKFHG